MRIDTLVTILMLVQSSHLMVFGEGSSSTGDFTPMYIRRELKSQDEVSVYTDLLIQLIRDAANVSRISSKADVARDVKYVEDRISNEGLPFLTVRLPALGKALDRALSTGDRIELPPGFRGKTLAGRKLPCFLHDYFKLIDDHWEMLKGDLSLISNETKDLLIKAVHAIRQVSYLFYKLRMPFTEEANQEAMDKTAALDSTLPHPDDSPDLSKEAQEVIEGARTIICAVLSNTIEMSSDVLRPRHGSGAVATREKAWKKYLFKRFYPNLDRVFPYSDYFFVSYTHLADRLELLEDLEVVPDAISRATTVPKDSRGPRVISMEPLEIMFIQQALKSYLYDTIERHPATSGRVNFASQDVNREFCQMASMSRTFQTLDLKEASDRVSLWLVEQLFPEPWIEMLNACRSTHCDYSGKVVELRKFAPMGSAVCFPIESLIFYALAVACTRPILLRRDIDCDALVRVYGDDLIVPSGLYGKVRRIFKELHLELNEDKCCTSTIPWRESCGYDSFLGENVAPLRIKHRWRPKLSPQALMAWCKYQNVLATSPGLSTYLYVTELLNSQPFPILNVANRKCEHNPCIILRGATWQRVLASNPRLRLRWNADLQRMEYRMRGTSPVTIYVTQEDGWIFMFDKLTGRFDPESLPITEVNEGAYAVANQLKIGWRWIPLSEVF